MTLTRVEQYGIFFPLLCFFLPSSGFGEQNSVESLLVMVCAWGQGHCRCGLRKCRWSIPSNPSAEWERDGWVLYVSQITANLYWVIMVIKRKEIQGSYVPWSPPKTDPARSPRVIQTLGFCAAAFGCRSSIGGQSLVADSSLPSWANDVQNDWWGRWMGMFEFRK